jgi:Tfp pilus assembly protein PilN
MKTLDLMPPETAIRREARRRVFNWARRLALGASLAGLLYACLGALASAQEAELTGLSREYSALNGRLQSAGGLLTERNRLTRNYEAISLLANERKTTDVLRTLGSALTPESYLSFLQIDRRAQDDTGQAETPSDPGGGTLRVRGFAPGHGQVGDFIKNLITSETFSEVRLVWTKDASADAAPSRVEFEVECSLKDPAAPGPRNESVRGEGGV